MEEFDVQLTDAQRSDAVLSDHELVPADRLQQLRDVIFAVAGDDVQRRNDYEKTLDWLKQPIVQASALVSDARAAMGGSRASLNRLITTFVILSSKEGESFVPAGFMGPRSERSRRYGDSSLPMPSPVSEEALGVLTLALSYASVTEPELAGYMRGGFGTLLTALTTLDLLWALSPGVVEGDQKSAMFFRYTLDWLEQASRFRDGIPDFPGLPDLPEKLKWIPFDPRDWLERIDCYVTSMSRVNVLPLLTPYTITAMTTRACEGQVVTITGNGFGNPSGQISFPTASGARILQPLTWSDIQVTVTVPANAVCGEIELIIPGGTTTTCTGEEIQLNKPRVGNSYFDGANPYIMNFTANMFASKLRVNPSTTVTFRWKACPGNTAVRLLVTEIESGLIILDRQNLPSDSQFMFQIPAYTTLRNLRCVLEASGLCAPSPVTERLEILVAPVPNVVIEGMEVTQGMQRFWRANITANSISTVANKETIVRVYVSVDLAGFNNNEVPGIWGTLDVGNVTLYPINGITPTNPSGGNPFFTARHRNSIDRRNINHTLNFRIPAYLCNGTRQLFCYLIVPGPGGVVDQTVGQILNWTWDVEPPLKVRWVRIEDNHDPVNVPPTTPTDAQARTTVERALEVLPFPPSDLRAAPFPTHTTTRDFSIDAEGAALRVDIDNIRTATEVLSRFGSVPFDPQERWIGLTVPWFRGWGSPNTCVAPIYTGGTGRERLRAAHELGHTLGFCHLHDAGCLKANGLSVEPTLEDVAVDPFWNRAIAETGHDFMSYTTPDDNWITSRNWDAARAAV